MVQHWLPWALTDKKYLDSFLLVPLVHTTARKPPDHTKIESHSQKSAHTPSEMLLM